MFSTMQLGERDNFLGIYTNIIRVFMQQCKTIMQFYNIQIVTDGICFMSVFSLFNEPVHEKTNNLGSDQVRHKPGCTVTEDG